LMHKDRDYASSL